MRNVPHDLHKGSIMLLAILIYLIQFLNSLKIFTGVMAAICILAGVIYAVYVDNMRSDDPCRYTEKVEKGAFKPIFKRFIITVISLILVNIIIPSQTTSYTMAAAYVTQTIAETPQAKEIGGKVLTIINAKLDEIIAEELPKSAEFNIKKATASDVTPDGKDLKK